MNVKTNIIPISYIEDEIKILLKTKNDQINKIITNQPQTNIQKSIQKWIANQFKIQIDQSQTTISNIIQNENEELIINIIILIKIKQNPKIEEYLKYHNDYDLENVDDLIKLQIADKEIINQNMEFIRNQYQTKQLSAIEPFIPKTFTTYYLSNLLSKLTKQNIKPNNIKRTFQNQIKFLRKDHSHRGNPKSIFEYKKA